jgi:hypothetical protein
MKTIDDDLCTLIPLYKPEFFLATIRGIIAQSVLPKELLISDDSLNGFLISDPGLQEVISSALPKVKISYLRGPQIGALSNVRYLLSSTKQEFKYVHILLDDDLIWPSFYERHLNCLRKSQALCSVSLRFVVDEAGLPIEAPVVPSYVRDSNDRYIPLDYSRTVRTVIPSLNNWIGELSNSLFDRNSLNTIFGASSDFRAHGLEDIGAFLYYSRRATAVLIVENLSCFRRSAIQNTASRNSDAFKASILGWIPLSDLATRDGVISQDEHYACVQSVVHIFNEYLQADDPDTVADLAAYLASDAKDYSLFNKLWTRFINSAPDYSGRNLL